MTTLELAFPCSYALIAVLTSGKVDTRATKSCESSSGRDGEVERDVADRAGVGWNADLGQGSVQHTSLHLKHRGTHTSRERRRERWRARRCACRPGRGRRYARTRPGRRARGASPSGGRVRRRGGGKRRRGALHPHLRMIMQRHNFHVKAAYPTCSLRLCAHVPRPLNCLCGVFPNGLHPCAPDPPSLVVVLVVGVVADGEEALLQAPGPPRPSIVCVRLRSDERPRRWGRGRRRRAWRV